MKRKLLPVFSSLLQVSVVPMLFSALIFFGCGNNSATGPNSPNSPDTSYVNYIILTPAGGVSDTLRFTDRSHTTGYYTSSSNSTYCLLNDTVNSQSVSLTFDGSTAGNPAFTFGFLSYNGGSYNASAISGSVSLYEAVGGKIKGAFSGTFAGGSVTYQGVGEFTAIRKP